MAIQSISEPEALDPHRPVRPHGTAFAESDRPEDDLRQALSETCDYAQQLWHTLYDVRAYLLDSLPPEPAGHPRAGRTPPVARCASPTGPDDEEGWRHWTETFAAVTSALCGPRGDSTFGLSRARHEEAKRRHPRRAGVTDDGAGGRRVGRAAALTALVVLAARGGRYAVSASGRGWPQRHIG